MALPLEIQRHVLVNMIFQMFFSLMSHCSGWSCSFVFSHIPEKYLWKRDSAIKTGAVRDVRKCWSGHQYCSAFLCLFFATCGCYFPNSHSYYLRLLLQVCNSFFLDGSSVCLQLLSVSCFPLVTSLSEKSTSKEQIRKIMIFRYSDCVHISEKQEERKEKRQKVKDGSVIMMETTLTVLVDSINIARGTVALCKFRLVMDRKDPHFRGLRILNGLPIKIVGSMIHFQDEVQ